MMALDATLPARTGIRIPAFSRTGSPETDGWLLSNVSDGIRSRGGNTQAKMIHTIKMDGFEQVFDTPTKAVRAVQRRSTDKRDQVNGWKFIYITDGPHEGRTLSDLRTSGGQVAAAAGGPGAAPPARLRLHEILNLDPSTSARDIRKAYMAACLRMHPDQSS